MLIKEDNDDPGPEQRFPITLNFIKIKSRIHFYVYIYVYLFIYIYIQINSISGVR